jgi:D-2-hydroxyacid dehydrogenase (NADP+)
MSCNILIVDNEAQSYLNHLVPLFPNVNFLSALNAQEAAPLIGDAEVLISNAVWMDAVALKKAEKLRWIQCTITGTDRLTPVLAGRNDMLLTNARGIHGRQMSEMAVLHMLALSRKVKTMVRNQDKHVFDRFNQRVLVKRIVGILGVGMIAESLAKLCKALGMTVYGISRTPRQIEGFDKFYTRDQLIQVAGEVDFLVVLVPLTKDTEKIINAEVLDAMKPEGYLINISRGGVVDEAALIEALRQGKIAGAGLDVFRNVPLPVESPLWDMENVFITPFVAGRSDQYVHDALTIVEPNLRHFLTGEIDQMINIVKY